MSELAKYMDSTVFHFSVICVTIFETESVASCTVESVGETTISLFIVFSLFNLKLGQLVEMWDLFYGHQYVYIRISYSRMKDTSTWIYAYVQYIYPYEQRKISFSQLSLTFIYLLFFLSFSYSQNERNKIHARESHHSRIAPFEWETKWYWRKNITLFPSHDACPHKLECDCYF